DSHSLHAIIRTLEKRTGICSTFGILEIELKPPEPLPKSPGSESVLRRSGRPHPQPLKFSLLNFFL
ncbi:hypothetical protein STEG23_032234, partial [Scotinomys teguina]